MCIYIYQKYIYKKKEILVSCVFHAQPHCTLRLYSPDTLCKYIFSKPGLLFVLSCRFVMGGGQWVPSRRVWGAPRYLDYTDFNTQNLEKPEFSQILKGGGGV